MIRTSSLIVTASTALLLATNVADAAKFRWAFQSDISSLDPMSTGNVPTRSTMQNVLEAMVEIDANMKVAPGLAVSWENINETQWKFNLRRNVKFHNGEAFTADDVVFSFRRATAASSDTRPRVRNIKSVSKIDDHTVMVETNGPSPTLLSDLTFLRIYSKAWAEANDSVEPMAAATGKENFASRNANGTGPFRVTSYQPGVRLVMVRNDAWWGRHKGNVTEATFTPITSESTRVAALLGGQVDFINPVPQQDVPRINPIPGSRS